MDLTPADDRESWQADAVNVSAGGMSMRAPVLPEVGEQLALSFKPEGASTIGGRGEVVWAADKGPHGGTFGLRFTDLAPAAEESLRRMLESPSAPAAKPPPVESRVKLFIHGMDAPLRARVRRSDEGEVIVGSDLSFLKLGDKVDVDGAGSKVTGSIVKVDVEVDAKTRVPRLVLSIDLGNGRRKTADIATAPTVMAASPRTSDPDLPAVKAPAAIEPAPRRVAQATEVLADESPVSSQPDGELQLDDPPPGWLTQGVRAVRGAAGRFGDAAGPAMRRAAGAVGSLGERLRGRRLEAEESDGGAPVRRGGLRPQHPSGSSSASSSEGDALVTSPGRNRKVGLYAVVGLVVAAGIVAYASSSGPKVETPRPQVAVNADAPADPNAPPADPGGPALAEAAQPGEAMPEAAAEQGAAPSHPEPRWVPARAPRGADLAAAADAPGGGEAPMIQGPAQRAARPLAQRPMAPAAQRPFAAQPAAQRQVAVAQPAARQVVMAPAQVVAQGPARPAVFGNPAVRGGTVLRLRMDGPIGQIQGVGARGAQIVLSVPGRHSLDVAAPLAQVDPRIAGAGVYNRATGAELTLRFREPAPPFVARSRGNVLEIVLGQTPGQPARAAVRAPLALGPRR